MKLSVLVILIATLSACTSIPGDLPAADSGYAALPLQNCNTDLRYLNQVLGWQTSWPTQWQSVVTTDPALAEQAIHQWSEISKSLAITAQNLKAGIINGETVPRIVAERVYEQVNALLLELSTTDSIYLFENQSHENARTWNQLVTTEITPAIAEFKIFLQNQYLPATHDVPGLAERTGGEVCFFQAVSWWTSLSLTQHEIEDIGWQVLNNTRKELLSTGNEGETIEDILNHLRLVSETSGASAKEIISLSESALVRAHENSLSVFSHQASADLVVSELAPHLHNSFPAGRYTGAVGNEPGRYIINPSRPKERRLMAEVIAFHEGIPGHHLWVTYPRKTPVSNSSSGFAGLSEGWAIYAEYLADEMDLYSSTLDRQGMMAKHLWAASRLIVEPGIHLRGWSREQAIAFMLENTVMSRVEIELEIDRYIAMPGQSLSYILGSEMILSERKRAREFLGDQFDLKAFHDTVLGSGLRPLETVRTDIRNWIQETMIQ